MPKIDLEGRTLRLTVNLDNVRDVLDAKDYCDSIAAAADCWWAVKFDTRQVRLVDFPYGMLDEVAQQHATTWRQLVKDPQANLSAARILIAKAAGLLGVTPPTNEPTILELLDRFTLIPMDLPDMPDDASGVDPSGSSTTTGS